MSPLEFIVFLPILGAIAILVGSPARFTALAVASVNLVAAIWVLTRFDLSLQGADGFPYQFTSERPIMMGADGTPWLSLSFGVDGISAALLLLTVLVTIAAVWVAPAESRVRASHPGERNPALYYISLLLISAGGLGAFLATDLFFFFAFHELALIPTFLMIGLFGHGSERRRVAWKTTIYLSAGGLILLVGLVATVFALDANTLSFVGLQEAANAGTGASAEAQRWIFLVLLIGFGILVSLFPFHTWAAPAYATAPEPVAMLHAGVLKKFGLYGLIRIALPMLPEGAAHWQNLLLVLLLGNVLIIGLVTIAQKRLDLMLGNSSVMHMGYVFLGIAAINLIGLHGAVLLMFAHGVSIALQFALCGALRDRVPSLEFDKLGGLASRIPVLALIFAFGAFASIGLPGFANFSAEVMVYIGAFKPFFDRAAEDLDFLQVAGMLSIWGVVISAVYMLRAFRSIFKGPEADLGEAGSHLRDLDWRERLPLLLLVLALLALGFVPGLLLDYLSPTLESVAQLAG